MITCSAFVIYVLSFNGESLSSETLKFNPILYLFYKNDHSFCQFPWGIVNLKEKLSTDK